MARSAGPGLVVTFLLALAACGDDGPVAGGPDPVDLTGEAGPAAARVDGRAISVAEVQRVVDETDLSPREALDRLVERELLYGEARRRGLGGGRPVVRARQQAAVQALLVRAVEDAIPPSSIDEAEVRARYETDERYTRPERRRSTHVLFMVEGDDADAWDRSEALAEQTLRELQAAADPDTVLRRYRDIGTVGGLVVRVEDLDPAAPNELYQASFLEGLFAGEGLGPSPRVVRSSFGWHAIVVTEILERRQRPFESVEVEIRDELAARHRAERVAELTEELSQRFAVTVEQAAVPFAMGVNVDGAGTP